MGVPGTLERHQDLFKFVQVRHEEESVFMACAHAKYTGEVGVCMATSGLGAIHLLNGLYDAKMDHQPVVAIVGQSACSALGGNYQQEVDLQNLFKDVASEYVQTITNAVQARQVIDRAVRIAMAERTVTCIIIPKDVQDQDAVEKPPRKHNTVHTGIGYYPTYPVPRQEDLQSAADILNAGQKVAILVGAGVAKALLGKQVLPDDLPYVTGGLCLRREMMDYNHWAALGVLGEILPWEDNRVGIADEKDQYGIPVAKVNFKLHDNDKKIAKAGVAKVTEVMQAAGAQEVVQEAWKRCGERGRK